MWGAKINNTRGTGFSHLNFRIRGFNTESWSDYECVKISLMVYNPTGDSTKTITIGKSNLPFLGNAINNSRSTASNQIPTQTMTGDKFQLIEVQVFKDSFVYTNTSNGSALQIYTYGSSITPPLPVDVPIFFLWMKLERTEIIFPISGTFANRSTNSRVGFEYFATDRQTAEGTTNGIPLKHKGSDVWVDSLGRVVV